jgi:ABC-type lipoprotein export system ATPase subunit
VSYPSPAATIHARLVNNPAIILADEPPQPDSGRAEIMHLLLSLNKEIAHHSISSPRPEVAALTQRIIHRDGVVGRVN